MFPHFAAAFLAAGAAVGTGCGAAAVAGGEPSLGGAGAGGDEYFARAENTYGGRKQ